MKYLRIIIIPIVIIIMISLGGCKKASTSDETSTSENKTEESSSIVEASSFTQQPLSSNRVVPNLDVLSDTSFNGNTYFNKHYDRILFHDGNTTQEIKSNDPRLIRMLNFIGFAMENNDFSMTQGQVSEDYYHWKLEDNKYFELTVNEYDIKSYPYYSKYIINNCGFMAIRTDDGVIDAYPEEDIPYAIWYEPYSSILFSSPDMNSFNGKNLLSYCGY